MIRVRAEGLATVKSGDPEENERVQEMPGNRSLGIYRIQDEGERGVSKMLGAGVAFTELKHVAGRGGAFGVMGST